MPDVFMALKLARLMALEMKPLDPHLDALLAQDPPCRYYRLLYFLAEMLKPAIAVELGTCTGRAAAHLAAGWRDCQVHCVDPEEHGAWRGNIAPYPNVTFHCARSDDPATLALFQNGTVGLCFVDSVHAADYTLKEVGLWTPKLSSGGLFLFDDLRLPSMAGVLERLPFAEKGELDGMHDPAGFGFAVVRR